MMSSLLGAMCLFLLGSPVVPASGTTPRQEYLRPGRAVERELKGGESHTYLVRLEAGQYLRAVVVQKGVDVVVRLHAPGGQKLTEVDSPNGAQGPEPVSLIAEEGGEYRLEVGALDGKAAAGRYESRVEDLREATAEDRTRVRAETTSAAALVAAEQLRAQRTAESLRKALEKYNEALPPLRFLKETWKEAHTLTQAGWVSRRLGESAKALDYYRQALPLWRAAGDVREEANTLNNIAVAYVSAGDGPQALDYYKEALPLWRAAGNVREEGHTLHSLGVIYWQLGDSQKALEQFNQALPLRRAAGDRLGEGTTLLGIGSTYEDRGKLREALEYYDLSLALREAIGDRQGEGATLNNIGSVYWKLGESQKALGYYDRALTLFRALGERREEAATLSNIAEAYWQPLGDSRKALAYLNMALSLWRAAGNHVSEHASLRHGEARTLQRLGAIHGAEGDARMALEYLDQALSLSRAIGNPRQEAYDLDTIGMVYGSVLGDSRKALELFEQALVLRRATGDRMGEAVTLSHIGAAHSLSGRLGEALSYLRQALALHRAVGDKNGEAETLKYIASVERDLGHLDEARNQIEAALDIHEGARSRLFSQHLRASFSASRQDYYEFYTDLLMRMHKARPGAGYEVAALQAAERARARGLLEMLTESRADIRQGVDAGLVELERSLRQRLSAETERLARLLGGAHTEGQAAAVRKEVEALLARYQEVETRIREGSPRYAALTQPRPLAAVEIQRLLEKETLLLEYSLGEERSYLWAVTASSVQSFELPKREVIETLARRVYESMTARNKIVGFEEVDERRARVAQSDAEFVRAGGALSEMLLGPAAHLMKVKRLLVVSDGMLQYLPFAALPLSAAAGKVPQPANYLPVIARYEVVSLPSASTLSLLRKEVTGRKPAPRTVAVLADPVFDRHDERVKGGEAAPGAQRQAPKVAVGSAEGAVAGDMLTRSVSDLTAGEVKATFPFPRLPFTKREAEAIVALVPPGQYEKAVDFAASREAALDPGLSRYRYIHFATHAILNERHPELSGIVLSLVDQDGRSRQGFLLAHEVYNLSLPAELVVLSGCQTGLGKEVRGEGLVGLTRGFMYAGSPRVVVSLWDVYDRSTAELMSRFYEGMLGRPALSPAAALRRAQLAMWRSPRWRAPFYWAAFTLHGEYR